MALSYPRIPSTAQHFLECGIEDCDKNCEFFCNTCQKQMCKQCKNEHRKNLKTENHEVVLYQLRERPVPVKKEDSKTRRGDMEAESRDIKSSTKQSPKGNKLIPEGREDIIYETFYHKSGKEFQCMYLDEMRFYLDDWGSKEWQPFPKWWYKEGLLITKKQNEKRHGQQQQSSGEGASGSRQQQPGYQQQSSSGQDDREGVLNHPKRGRIPTYIFQRRHNIHCFYDHTKGQWMRLPINWELHHEMVGKLVDQVEKALPTWGDRQDILALLRQCNYDPDECMSTYLHLEGDPWLKDPKTQQKSKSPEKKDKKIEQLQQQLKEAKEKIVQLETENLKYKTQSMSVKGSQP